MAKFMVRQGDVLITQVDEIPEGAAPSKRKMAGKGLVTLAYGEVTGHHHSIKKDNNVALLETEDALGVFLSIMGEEGATLTHQEHKAITLPPGKYGVTIQREYSPEAIQNVLD